MSNKILIHNAIIINEGIEKKGSVLIDGKTIESIFKGDVPRKILDSSEIIEAGNKYLIPGIIDDHVHFREPGLTHKGDIYTESRAAIAGGITSFMEMPNTIPQTTTQTLLEEKYRLAAEKSIANYSFYIGATNDNLEELLKTNPETVCGIKLFMGSSTGNMMVDDNQKQELIFKNVPVLLAVHSEDEQIIKDNMMFYTEKYGADIPFHYHPQIRSEEACVRSTTRAVELARKFGTRLHILHLSTGKELELLENQSSLQNKQITAEVCIHHLWFDDHDYTKYGSLIKCNPAIKKAKDRENLMKGLLNDTIDVIATDHAPHTEFEKNNPYTSAPSGGPMVQHSLNVMLELSQQHKLSREKIVQKMCHHPAEIFKIHKRGYIREGYFADLVLVDQTEKWTVDQKNILYKCKWSSLQGHEFTGKITHTFVNGNLVYENGTFTEHMKGMRLRFDRT